MDSNNPLEKEGKFLQQKTIGKFLDMNVANAIDDEYTIQITNLLARMQTYDIEFYNYSVSDALYLFANTSYLHFVFFLIMFA